MPVVQKNLLVLGTPSHPGKTNVVEVLSNQNYGYQESLPSTTAVDLGEVNGGKFGDTTFRGKVIDTPSDYKKAGSYFSTADLIAYVVDGTKSFKEQEVELRQLQAYVQEQTMERDPKPPAILIVTKIDADEHKNFTETDLHSVQILLEIKPEQTQQISVKEKTNIDELRGLIKAELFKVEWAKAEEQEKKIDKIRQDEIMRVKKVLEDALTLFNDQSKVEPKVGEVKEESRDEESKIETPSSQAGISPVFANKLTAPSGRAFKTCLEKINAQIIEDTEGGDIPERCSAIATAIEKLAPRVAKAEVTLEEIQNFHNAVSPTIKKDIRYQRLIGGLIGAAIGVCIGVFLGAMLGSLLGPGAAFTALAAGAFGATLGASIGAGAGLFGGAYVGSHLSLWRHPLNRTERAAKKVQKGAVVIKQQREAAEIEAKAKAKIVKIALVGGLNEGEYRGDETIQGVGKTAFLGKWVKGEFLDFNQATIGAAYCTRYLRSDTSPQVFSLEIRDTAGQWRYHGLTAMYFRDSDAVLFFVDSTVLFDQQKERLTKFYDMVCQYNSKFKPIVIISKVDDEENRKITSGDIAAIKSQFDKHEDISIIEVSAKTGAGIDQVEKRLFDLFSEPQKTTELENPRKTM